jgi:hypothetical protein
LKSCSVRRRGTPWPRWAVLRRSPSLYQVISAKTQPAS